MRGAGTFACRAGTPCLLLSPCKRREESRRGRQDCLRYVSGGQSTLFEQKRRRNKGLTWALGYFVPVSARVDSTSMEELVNHSKKWRGLHLRHLFPHDPPR